MNDTPIAIGIVQLVLSVCAVLGTLLISVLTVLTLVEKVRAKSSRNGNGSGPSNGNSLVGLHYQCPFFDTDRSTEIAHRLEQIQHTTDDTAKALLPHDESGRRLIYVPERYLQMMAANHEYLSKTVVPLLSHVQQQLNDLRELMR